MVSSVRVAILVDGERVERAADQGQERGRLEDDEQAARTATQQARRRRPSQTSPLGLDRLVDVGLGDALDRLGADRGPHPGRQLLVRAGPPS